MGAAIVLRTARRAAALGLRELARRAGTSHATLAAYEAGAKDPRWATVERIVAAAGGALEVGIARRADRTTAARVAKGDELAAVLELAAAFPARHEPTLGYPPFPGVR